jgi:hypothetical protein
LSNALLRLRQTIILATQLLNHVTRRLRAPSSGNR